MITRTCFRAFPRRGRSSASFSGPSHGPERIVHPTEGRILPPACRRGVRGTARVLSRAQDGGEPFAGTRGQEHIAKVSSVEYMRTLIGRALPESRWNTPAAPHGLPNRPDTLHFTIDPEPPRAGDPEEPEHLPWWDQAPRDTKADLGSCGNDRAGPRDVRLNMVRGP